MNGRESILNKPYLWLPLLLALLLSPIPAAPVAAASAPSLQVAKVGEYGAYGYAEASYVSPILTLLGAGEAYPVISSSGNFYQIQYLSGEVLWVSKSSVSIAQQRKIVLGWQAFGTTDDYIRQAKAAKGVNVVSPRWLELNKTTLVSGSIDARYVNWAHSAGIKVWVLLGNRFDPVMTDQLINSKEKRAALVKRITTLLVQGKVDGLNVDFENINIKNKQDYVELIKQLKASLAPKGMTLSVDVTRENPDPFWSGSLDRRELGKAADYVLLMGYEQHWATSDTPGSLGTYPWVKEGLQLLENDVPAQKIILGIPFFNRKWTSNPLTKKVSSTELTMAEVQKLIVTKHLQKKWDTEAVQSYVEFTEKGVKNQIWIEDRDSISYRVRLTKTHSIGGMAGWYIGQETPDVWASILTKI
ncbi:MAG: glycosyl hydrolase family 18 protein [Clostridia bacterium]